MGRVRSFRLKNAYGEYWDLMQKDAFFYQPKGLGWGRAVKTERVGNSFIVVDDQTVTQTVSGIMVFTGYQNYKDFLQFCIPGGLVLCYTPINTERYLECSMIIQKSEINYETGKLECEVEFNPTSEWYENTLLLRPQQQIDDYAKIYLDEHGYAYDYAYEDSTSGGITITNEGLPSYFRIKFFGLAENPSWRLYVSNELVHSGKLNATIPQDHYLIVNTIPSQMEISEYDGDGNFYLDRFGDIDYTQNPIFTIPSGESMMVFTDDSTSVPNVALEVFKRVPA